ncbi:ejaculatory bulb-specific protein 3-like [Sitophilus oryzae]|uniref:Ejaculatory bulb-specific protein 3-like n=1 Tax=Sitophilus oryzae TaxID=7048 RepID=A0A6J2Y3P1_SITOR|nr:ejaculatory bulb-specific protein 3-like [Sitophilus oryzae]
MKSMVVGCLVVLVAVIGLSAARPDDQYTTKYDNVDLDEILKSDRLLRNYINCLLDKGKCTPDGAELKKVLPDALDNECSKCSEKQRNGAIKVVHYVIDNKRDWWNEVAAKYDPDGTYLKKYEEQAKKENINL